jgi:hypothetical protein
LTLGLPDGEALRGGRLGPWLWASGLSLSTLSFAVVVYAASEEPFFSIQWLDVIVIFGLGGVVFASFLIWIASCAYAYLRTPRKAPVVSLLLCACIVCTGLNLFYLGESAYRYVQDLRDALARFG